MLNLLPQSLCATATQVFIVGILLTNIIYSTLIDDNFMKVKHLILRVNIFIFIRMDLND